MNTFYFIVNPKAGNGKGRAVWKRAEQKLNTLHIPYRAFFTEYPGHAIELSRTAAGLADGEQAVVVAVGGDGTAHEVLNGLGAFATSGFGFIPAGSGNDFSRGFGIPADPMDALGLLLGIQERNPSSTDCGSLNLNGKNHLFINSAGAGFDALVSKKANESRLKGLFNRLSLGKLVYVYILLKELASYNRTPLQVTIDGNVHSFKDAWFATVSNQPYYGGGMIISPCARPDDGELDITVVHRLSKAKLLLVFMSVFWGKHTSFEEVHMFKGKEIKIQTTSPIHIHADGEYIGMANTGEIMAVPGAAKLAHGTPGKET
ncbi:diacylglycerol kinase family lipid kinase [Neobacillus piezotolerans]|uniref:Diacylglycerol kinase family lipid kinase n=1 Tax=Neobacillus piezotolerans TaxID=2259171 RepID=A0A3D8GP11_9BACI|nr:diacylglycerol kinase family protein [Neobacillus piezotolerans]RDU36158.1 diacylglycerol kinase family lipid kinase [Neobacillus piezotolerans]